MMRLESVICELNPIHLGHKLVFDRAAENADVVCAVMSGNFVQRGEPACFDKYARAHAALLSGCDLVVELPFPWCASGAESFALGGVSVAAGILSGGLTFGSESGRLDYIEQLASVKSSPEFKSAIRETETESRGLGSAVIFERTLQRLGIESMPGANDKLASDYVRFGLERDCGMTYTAVARMSDMRSAAELRALPFSDCEPYMPSAAFRLLGEAPRCRDGYAELLFRHALLYLRDTDDPILQLAAKKAREVMSAEKFMSTLGTKKYTAARMRRELLFSICGVQRGMLKVAPRYTILLAANERGRRYLSENRRRFSISVITKPADYLPSDEVELSLRKSHLIADELYCLINGLPIDTFVKRHPEFGRAAEPPIGHRVGSADRLIR